MDKETIASAAHAAISPLKTTDSSTEPPEEILLWAERTKAGLGLPPYYLVYFLLVDLLGFHHLGKDEKVAWSIPVDFRGKGFMIQHRKLGLGIFAPDAAKAESDATSIVERIQEATNVAAPYFAQLADSAADGSNLNVINRSSELYDRHMFYMEQYEAKYTEAERRKDAVVRTQHGPSTSYRFPAVALWREAEWLALSAINTFFSWTEHVFIHVAILNGNLLTGRQVRDAANANWHQKFNLALDQADPETSALYVALGSIRQQIRNFNEHGSFGKGREAFSFHSPVGAVPLRLTSKSEGSSARFGRRVTFSEAEAVDLIKKFNVHLWSGSRAPARLYLETDLPLILSFAKDGTYSRAMASEEAMAQFCEYQCGIHDMYANMDF